MVSPELDKTLMQISLFSETVEMMVAIFSSLMLFSMVLAVALISLILIPL
jgi:hypothetical protein